MTEKFESRPWLLFLAPGLFVLLWSTGFIGAKLGLPFAEPLTFLLVRFACVIGLLGTLAWALRRPWPHRPMQWFHIAVAGVLLHGGYLSGVFLAIHRGMPAGVVALIVGIQPLLTAFLSNSMVGERVSGRHALGIERHAGMLAQIAVKPARTFHVVSNAARADRTFSQPDQDPGLIAGHDPGIKLLTAALLFVGEVEFHVQLAADHGRREFDQGNPLVALDHPARCGPAQTGERA